MNISIAIPTHDDRWCYTSKTIANIHDNEHVVEIILVDDHSSDEIYNRLVSAVKEYPKVKLFRNDTQEFVFLNKYIAVSHCTSDWVALLDSDNIFDCNFIDRMCEQEADSHIIYCPDKALPRFDFSPYVNLMIDKENCKKFLEENLFEVFLNTGNYCFNRQLFLEILKPFFNGPLDPSIYAADVIWMNYHFLKNGMVFKIIHGTQYEHSDLSEGTWRKYHDLNPGKSQEAGMD
jgi:glycosyltransferase involved in cell wall biosynthesis